MMFPHWFLSPFTTFFATIFLALSVAANAETIRIKASYAPLAEPAQLGEEEAKEKATAEKLDTHDLLYTGKVVVDQDAKMLAAPESVAQFKGEHYVIAKAAPKVEFGVIPATPFFFPEPVDDHHRAFWASWGKSAYYPANGKFYTSIGDNGSYDAHLYIVEYDPATLTLKLSPEINDALGRPATTIGEGKIHGCLDFVDGPVLWFCTYWSKYPEPNEGDWQTGYTGGHIMSYNVETGDLMDYGVPMLRASWPSHRVDPQRRMLYAAGYYSEFLAWDMDKREPRWMGHLPDGMRWSNRTFLIDDKTGKVYTGNSHESDPDFNLIEYDPEKNRFALLDAPMPKTAEVGEHPSNGKPTGMRACTTRRGPDGLFYGCTHSGELFSFDPDTVKVADLGVCWPGKQRYTTSMQISPGGRYVYYVPGAHGHGCLDGSPLMQYDTKTGQRKVLAFLAPFYAEKYGYTPSGAFSCQLDEKGERLFICWNGGFLEYEVDKEGNTGSLFATNALMVVHIPESEREE